MTSKRAQTWLVFLALGALAFSLRLPSQQPAADRVRELVDGACRLGEDDPACAGARRVTSGLSRRRDGGLSAEGP